MSGPNESSHPNTTEEKLKWFADYFRPHFDEWVVGPINRLVPSQDALIGFILMACAIDYLAGFWWGEDTTGKVKPSYTGFVGEYFPPDKYDPVGIYDSLRNGLVHMFTIKAKKYALTHNNQDLHLTKDGQGQILLNAEDFRDDLLSAKDKYFDAVSTDSVLLDKLVTRYGREGFLALAGWQGS